MRGINLLYKSKKISNYWVSYKKILAIESASIWRPPIMSGLFLFSLKND